MPATALKSSPNPTTKSVLALLQETISLIHSSKSPSASPNLTRAILELHKALSSILQSLCDQTTKLLRQKAAHEHHLIKAANERIKQIYEEKENTHSRLAELRASRAGLWERVDVSLIKLSAAAEQDQQSQTWGKVQSFVSRVIPIIPTPVTTLSNDESLMDQKRRLRHEFRESAKSLQEVDHEIRRTNTVIGFLEEEENCLKGTVKNRVRRVGAMVRLAGIWERISQKLCGVGCDDVLILVGYVEGGHEEDAVDITVDAGELPSAVVSALGRYYERWIEVWREVDRTVESQEDEDLTVDGVDECHRICEELRGIVGCKAVK